MPGKLLIFIVMLNSVASQLLLKRAVGEIGSPTGFASLAEFFRAAAISPPVYLSLVLQVAGYAMWMIVISQQKLGVAIAVLGSGFYVVMAVLAWVVFDERLSPLQWAGIALVTAGVVCMMSGPST